MRLRYSCPVKSDTNTRVPHIFSGQMVVSPVAAKDCTTPSLDNQFLHLRGKKTQDQSDTTRLTSKAVSTVAVTGALACRVLAGADFVSSEGSSDISSTVLKATGFHLQSKFARAFQTVASVDTPCTAKNTARCVTLTQS